MGRSSVADRLMRVTVRIMALKKRLNLELQILFTAEVSAMKVRNIDSLEGRP